MAAGVITAQPKQGRLAMPMSSLSILLCLGKNIAVGVKVLPRDHRDCSIHIEIILALLGHCMSSNICHGFDNA